MEIDRVVKFKIPVASVSIGVELAINVIKGYFNALIFLISKIASIICIIINKEY